MLNIRYTMGLRLSLQSLFVNIFVMITKLEWLVDVCISNAFAFTINFHNNFADFRHLDLLFLYLGGIDCIRGYNM